MPPNNGNVQPLGIKYQVFSVPLLFCKKDGVLYNTGMQKKAWHLMIDSILKCLVEGSIEQNQKSYIKGGRNKSVYLQMLAILCKYTNLFPHPLFTWRKMTFGCSNWPIIEASVKKSVLALSLEPGFRVLMATNMSCLSGWLKRPRQTSPNSPPPIMASIAMYRVSYETLF